MFSRRSFAPVFRLRPAFHLASGLRLAVAAAIGLTAVTSAPAWGQTWTVTAPMGILRYGQTTTLLDDGRVLVVSGFDSPFTATAEIYDPLAGTWTYTGAIRDARVRHSAVKLRDGRVLIAGGADNAGNKNSVKLYDPATGAWTDGSP